MQISLRNYKNINHLDATFKDDSISFVFGMSGSGKSSIIESFTDETPIENMTFGQMGNQSILINGSVPNKDDFSVFDDSTVNRYFLSDEEEYIHEVLIDDEGEYTRAQQQLSSRITALDNQMLLLETRYNELYRFLEKIGAVQITKEGNLKKTSALYKVISSLRTFGNRRTLQFINNLPDGKLKWITKGCEYLEDGICPFCDKRMSMKKQREVHNLSEFDSTSVQNIKTEIVQYERFERTIFKNTPSGLETMSANCIQMSKARASFEELMTFLRMVKNFDTNRLQTCFPSLDSALYTYFPELKKHVARIEGDWIELQANYQKVKSKTAGIMSRKTRSIDKMLVTLGIPYCVEAKYKQGFVTDYMLVHKNDPLKRNSRSKLSKGEKCIVALVFFILSNAKNSKTILIDDPVSSYDEYRRKQILNIITTKLEGHTVVVFSHDSVFAKYACLEFNRKKCIGDVFYLENFDTHPTLKTIRKEDFGSFDSFLAERIVSASQYYQKIINIRMALEKSTSTIEYSYVSSILHATEPPEICRLLNERGYIETELIQKIEDRFGVKLPPVYNDYYKNINVDSFSYFEKVLFLREYSAFHPGAAGKVHAEISDYIHLNSRYYICLNPYEYLYSSPSLHETISTLIVGNLDLR